MASGTTARTAEATRSKPQRFSQFPARLAPAAHSDPNHIIRPVGSRAGDADAPTDMPDRHEWVTALVQHGFPPLAAIPFPLLRLTEAGIETLRCGAFIAGSAVTPAFTLGSVLVPRLRRRCWCIRAPPCG